MSMDHGILCTIGGIAFAVRESPSQVIPQFGRLPKELASISLGKVILVGLQNPLLHFTLRQNISKIGYSEESG
jgi:hypothetical protein